MSRNNLDMAMLLTDAILNEFEKNGKVKEYTYSKPKAAMNFVGKLMAQGHEFTVVDEESVHHMSPKDFEQ